MGKLARVEWFRSCFGPGQWGVVAPGETSCTLSLGSGEAGIVSGSGLPPEVTAMVTAIVVDMPSAMPSS